jgi:hypothetical protein
MMTEIERLVVELQRLPVSALRERYAELFGEASRSGNRQYLVRRIAWRVQANREGDLSERARKRAAELADDADLRVTAPRAPKTPTDGGSTATGALAAGAGRQPVPGTTLRRPYQGRTVLVHVLADGFEYEGKVYRSLTAVAEAVTGAHWNGRLFFGLPAIRNEEEPRHAS